MLNPHDKEAREISHVLPKGPRLGVLGSSSFWGNDSQMICAAIGRELSSVEGLVLLTGGVPGVGEEIGRAFWQESISQGHRPAVFHILPRGSGSWDYGITLRAGLTMLDRREVLGRLAHVYLVVEGGPGTEYETCVARKKAALLIPVVRTGGHAAELASEVVCPHADLSEAWGLLSDATVLPDDVATSVVKIVRQTANTLRP